MSRRSLFALSLAVGALLRPSGALPRTKTVPPSTATPVTTSTTTTTPLAFVQVVAATPQTNQTSVPVTFTGAQSAGNVNLIAIGWNSSSGSVSSVVDSANNVYQPAAPVQFGSGVSQTIWYAKSIAARAAGTNTVTVTFSGSMPYVDLRAAEYSGVDPVNPIDVTASAAGSSSAASSGAVTTTFANELLFGAGITTSGFSAATGGATTRIITTPDEDIVQDRVVSAVGTYSATASLYGNAAWVMQIVALRGAS